MAKKLCDLCGRNPENEMRFGVRLCQDCLNGYDRAMEGDEAAVAYFSNPGNFPNATDLTQRQFVSFLARRNQRLNGQMPQNPEAVIQQHEQQREAYAKTVGVAYKREDRAETKSTLDSLYDNIGGKIKGWAKWIFILETIVAVVAALGQIASGNGLLFVLLLFLGPLGAWVSSWLLYGFGELVEKTCANEENTRNILKLLLESNAQQEKK